jgi:hypothetical protein
MEEKTNEHLESMNREQAIHNGNEPAYPISNNTFYRTGLNKRETMAMHLVSAYIAKGETRASAVTHAVECADLLLGELRKNKAK